MWREVVYTDPMDVVCRIVGARNLTFLDSSSFDECLGRYSYIAFDPVATIKSDGNNVLDELQRSLTSSACGNVPGLPPFQGGFAGYLSYEFGCQFEVSLEGALAMPTYLVATLHAYDVVMSFDHLERRAYIVSTGYPETDPERQRVRAEARINELVGKISVQPAPDDGEYRIEKWRSNFKRANYEHAVRKVIEQILDGTVYQANIAQQFVAELPNRFNALLFYKRLRERNGSTFGAYLDYDEVCIASSSPERFLALDGADVEARPIKGTSRRYADPQRDEESRCALMNSEKDRAENVMIVDLLRNDLSKVCELGTVKVPVLCSVESNVAVHHLVSTIRGQLQAGLSCCDLIEATFPGGSITGAPKIKAMEVISSIEGEPRGVYCGSVGFIGFNGAMDLSIAIRTVVFSSGMARFGAGCGITSDSDPAAEYRESMDKVAPIFEVFEGVVDDDQ